MQKEKAALEEQIEKVGKKKEHAELRRETGKTHRAQLHSRLDQASALLDTLRAHQEPRAEAASSGVQLRSGPEKRLTVHSVERLTAEAPQAGLCVCVKQLLTQEAQEAACEVGGLAWTLGFDSSSLPGGIRMVDFGDEPSTFFDHVFLYIHQGVHIYCLLSRLRDAQNLLEGQQPPDVAPGGMEVFGPGGRSRRRRYAARACVCLPASPPAHLQPQHLHTFHSFLPCCFSLDEGAPVMLYQAWSVFPRAQWTPISLSWMHLVMLEWT